MLSIKNFFNSFYKEKTSELTEDQIRYIKQEEEDNKSLNEIWDEYIDYDFEYNNDFKTERFQSWLHWWYSPSTLLLMYQSLLTDTELAMHNKECYLAFSNHFVSKFRLFENKFTSNNKYRFIEIYKKKLDNFKKLNFDDQFLKNLNDNTNDIISNIIS